jgi:hypothetical protein
MSTPYGVSTNIGSSSYSGFVNTPISGPLSTNQYPSARPYSMYGTLPGKSTSTPPFFYSQNQPVNAELMTNARHQFLRTSVNKQSAVQQIAEAKLTQPLSYHIKGSDKHKAVSQHTNYIPPLDSSQYLNIIRANSVGQSGYNVGKQPFVSTKNYYPSGTRSSLRRVRSGGCVAPAKKGAIENNSLRNGQTCAWGSIVRSTY